MKVVFDILGSTKRSGGMRLHSTELIRAWMEHFPSDRITIVGGEWAEAEFRPRGARVVRWPNESVLGRSVGQVVATPAVGLAARADFVVSLSPIVSPLVPHSRAICFQHDWRHKKNPHEFPLLQRAYRHLWEVSARHAWFNVCISDKTAEETRSYVPRSRTVVIENGRDHARRWRIDAPVASERYIVSFGHHNNKRPELVLDAIAEGDIPSDVRVVVVGARGDYADELRLRVKRLGIEERIDFPGFVSMAEYERIVSGAAVIALTSSDEGFGLPIAEAEYFGIPAVITSDSGMESIFGGYPIVADPTPSQVAAALERALKPSSRRVSGDLQTWSDTAAELRIRLTAGQSWNGW